MRHFGGIDDMYKFLFSTPKETQRKTDFMRFSRRKENILSASIKGRSQRKCFNQIQIPSKQKND
jgi:hypothetical protein